MLPLVDPYGHCHLDICSATAAPCFHATYLCMHPCYLLLRILWPGLVETLTVAQFAAAACLVGVHTVGVAAPHGALAVRQL